MFAETVPGFLSLLRLHTAETEPKQRPRDVGGHPKVWNETMLFSFRCLKFLSENVSPSNHTWEIMIYPINVKIQLICRLQYKHDFNRYALTEKIFTYLLLYSLVF